MKNLHFILLFIGCNYILNAATLTSVGNGDWDDSVTWDTGTLPAYGDSIFIEHDVIIPFGYSTHVEMVSVESSGRLYIHKQAQLEITGDSSLGSIGIINEGQITTQGGILILECNVGISNRKSLLNRFGGTIKIKGSALINFPHGYL